MKAYGANGSEALACLGFHMSSGDVRVSDTEVRGSKLRAHSSEMYVRGRLATAFVGAEGLPTQANRANVPVPDATDDRGLGAEFDLGKGTAGRAPVETLALVSANTFAERRAYA